MEKHFLNKDVKSTEPGFVDFENAKISDLRGSNIVVYDGKILMSFDSEDNKDLDLADDEFKKVFLFVSLGLHDGTKNQFLSAEDEISKWQMEKGDERKVKVFKYKNDANLKKGMKERKIHYLFDSKDGAAVDNNNKIGLSTDTVFRIKGTKFGFTINVPGIENLETKVFAKKMVSQHLGQGLELKEENIEIIPDNPKESNNKETIGRYKKAVIEDFAKPEEGNLRSIEFLSIPNENLVIIESKENEAVKFSIYEGKESE